MTEYKSLQILKHALAYYIGREGAAPADIETEKRLLAKIEYRVQILQEMYCIEKKEAPHG